jgi:hypothetical protein
MAFRTELTDYGAAEYFIDNIASDAITPRQRCTAINISGFLHYDRLSRHYDTFAGHAFADIKQPDSQPPLAIIADDRPLIG